MLFCFSGTGNTQWAAQTVATALGESLLAVADELRGNCSYEFGEGERLGFCFPVHGWWPPAIVREFIARATFRTRPDTYVYVLATYGDSAGLAYKMLAKDLSLLGINVHANFGLCMPESYVCLPFMYTDKPQREKQKIESAAQQLSVFTDLIVKRSVVPHAYHSGTAPWLLTHVLGRWFNAHLITDRHFTVDPSRCIHCGLCQKACPTGDVALNDMQLPQWSHDGSCTCCMACYHHCPQHAINYGPLTRRRGQYFFGRRT